jgi:hypothetical protein
MKRDYFNELRKEVLEIRDRNPQLPLDGAFVVWAVKAFIVGDDESEAAKSLTGGAKDRGVDALYIDHESRRVFVIQAKYHHGPKIVNEKRSDVIVLADLGRALLNEDHGLFDELLQGANPIVLNILVKARQAIQKRKYFLRLQFITTGKVSKVHQDDATQEIEGWENAGFDVYAHRDLIRVMQDVSQGHYPVPVISLAIHGEQLFYRFDKTTGISSWVFSMFGRDLGKLYNDIGDRIFARNIRGYQGKTEVNDSIDFTIRKEPEHFWYLNNGVTVICDKARQITERGHNYLRVENGQIINGQQTVRTLAGHKTNAATLLAKVVVVPREKDVGYEQYSELVNNIVKATNWQNAIGQLDIWSNDLEQVRLEREFRKFGYFYIRKRQSKSEARRISGGHYRDYIKKEDLAQIVGASLLDPYEVRLGRNRLFDDDNYHIIFDYRRPTSEYLTLYLLGHYIIPYFSRGDYRRGYAKWLVTNFIWAQIGQSLRKRELGDNFRYIVEREDKYYKQFKPLYSAIEDIFKSTMAFYRLNRRTKEGTYLDESTFFKHKGRHIEFEKFWRSSKNTMRSQVMRKLDLFIKMLEIWGQA